MSPTALRFSDTALIPEEPYDVPTWTAREYSRSSNMANDFLHREYELCFEQLRFYDKRQNDLLRYLATLATSVATAQFALYKLFGSPTQAYFLCLAFLSAIVFIASLLMFLAMLQNRLYFVYVARQINAIRCHLLQHEAPEFAENQLYTSTKFSAIKPMSIHTCMLAGSALLASLFAGTFVYALCFLVSVDPSVA